jgi:hypothetical protein
MAFTRSSERRIGGARQLLVVLDEVDAGLDQVLHQFRRLVRAQAQRGLDDGADDGAVLHTRQPAASGDAELRPGMRAAEFLRQLHAVTRMPVKPRIE